MSLLSSIAVAFACFSTIPMPRVEWNRQTMRYMMAAFPLVGAVVGAGLWLWWQVAAALGLHRLATAVGLTLIPLAVTGGIHLDGFADVVDAQSSHAEPERKQAILKDPHVGAFAVIGIAGYLIACVALLSELEPEYLACVCLIPFIGRCLSGLAVVTLKPARRDGMYAQEHATKSRAVGLALVAELAASLVVLVLYKPAAALCMSGAALAVSVSVVRLARRDYRGMSGDLAGFLLQCAELAMLACVIVVERLAYL